MYLNVFLYLKICLYNRFIPFILLRSLFLLFSTKSQFIRTIASQKFRLQKMPEERNGRCIIEHTIAATSDVPF